MVCVHLLYWPVWPRKRDGHGDGGGDGGARNNNIRLRFLPPR